uniref:Protein FAR1-RELATED SEQUENCE n=1 Tax=Lactuca sativa TaxID=4236 RepID=A0A9R1UV90_LACSA|nr:hypothetical protein LSAT_V11C800444080 [Lactuca sativa]
MTSPAPGRFRRCFSDWLRGVTLDVPKEFKPTKSMRFKDVDEGVHFYKKRYAEKRGFDVRLNTLRKVGDIIKHRFLVCNRMGTGEYKFDEFQENHNHELEDTFHLKSTRTLSYSDKKFIVQASTAKMGFIKGYKLKSTLKGGFQYAFRVLMDKIFNEIPEQYILRRWTKDVISLNYQLLRDHFDEEDEEVTKLVNEVFFNVETALDIMRGDKQKLACLAEKTQFLFNEVKSNSSSKKPITNSDVLEKLYNVTIPEEVKIFVLDVQHNKGSQKKKLIGKVEKEDMKAQMKTRKCSICSKREPQ